ncbi:VOC family protein [Nocardioides sp. GY 10113]|uniref:VOC family protein n=1 Tax=Nocardioides sp. GY 10113 TaxID=2569761 RepID=UPI0010A8E4A5|nr:VOC family protein [Nocardioides sp. GY 10113]TIC89034.1 VOC family protein [Nocardioides sp. GY 10113]
MSLRIHYAFVPHTDPEASLAFYRDALGLEVRNDVGGGPMRWITVGSPDQPETGIVLHPPAVDPTISEEERRVIHELIAKGNYGAITLSSDDLDATFAAIEATGADVLQEPTDQDYGVRDCAFRDPAGNLVRINQI